MFGLKNKKQKSDAELVELSKIHQKHFGELYNRYFDAIFRFVFRRIGGDEMSAADLTQQTFLKAMGNIFKYENRGVPFSSWLYKIAQNEVNLHFRQQKKNTTIEIEEKHIHSMITQAEIGDPNNHEKQELLIHFINELPSDQMDLIELRFFQELSFKEIAEIYAITEANAKMRIYRILEKMNLKFKG